MLRAPLSAFALLAGFAITTSAEPLSKKTEIDFFRDVPSRNLKGFATRSDGRLVAGPVLKELGSSVPADLLWCLEPTRDPAKFLLGTGPDGKIVEVTLAPSGDSFAAKEVIKLDDPQVFTLKQLPDGTIIAGTSPKGGLYLIRDGKVQARLGLPVDSIFDLLVVSSDRVLVATGNPGRIYQLDVAKFAAAGVGTEKMTDATQLADRGLTLFGEIRDRNVRRIVALADGRIAAGSSPKGNIYTFARTGGAPVVLQENRDGEVTDLLPQPNGDLFASIVYSGGSGGESRIGPAAPRPAKDQPETPPPAQIEKFGGRSSIVFFPAQGFAETLTSRNGVALYRLVRFGDTLLASGGEQGDLLGYDLKARLSLTIAGSASAQLNGMVPLSPEGKFLVLRNNVPGLALLDFQLSAAREAETRRLDLGVPARLGAMRFHRLRELADQSLSVEVKVSNGSDEIEGWGAWTALAPDSDGGWNLDGLRGRYAKVRLRVPEGANRRLEIDKASLYFLPQNRRPTLQDFRVLAPNYALIVAAESSPPASVSLSSLMQSGAREDEGTKRKGNFLSSQVVPSPGSQIVLWTTNDPDGDSLESTFSIRRDGEETWIDLAISTRDSYLQFDTAHLPDGIYHTRLVTRETAPRPANERLAQTFETDDLIVDHSAPEILEAKAVRNGDRLVVSVQGRDRWSLLDGIEVVYNNGLRETVEQPLDGIRDSRREGFILETPLAKVSNATSAEVTLYDAAGNAAAIRLKL